jgi:DNA-binding transcriptional ArsR family regulator
MNHQELQYLREAARQASDLLKALSNENRLLVMCNLADGEKSVGQLQSIIGLSQSALSQHLARLRQDGLVKTRRESQTIYYSLAGDEASRVIAVLYELYCAPNKITTSDSVKAFAEA